ncbi:hypothetical protein YC2023_113981 [Brassica napus]
MANSNSKERLRIKSLRTWQGGSGPAGGCVSHVEKNIHSLFPSRKKSSLEGERRFGDRSEMEEELRDKKA